MPEHPSASSLKYHNRRVAVTKSFSFDAAHRLDQYEGKCKFLHGHTYRLEITVSGRPNEIGMVIDFADLKAIFKSEIEAKMDHRYLNEVLPQMNTTAENMIVWIWEQLDRALGARGLTERGCRLEALRFYETPTSWASITREWMVGDESRD